MVELEGHHSVQMYSPAESDWLEYCSPAEMFWFGLNLGITCCKEGVVIYYLKQCSHVYIDSMMKYTYQN